MPDFIVDEIVLGKPEEIGKFRLYKKVKTKDGREVWEAVGEPIERERAQDVLKRAKHGR